jgi:two-component system chemotaxis sensor kinase CheA
MSDFENQIKKEFLSETKEQELFQGVSEIVTSSLESVSQPQTATKPKDDSIRVSLSRIEKLLNNIGELSILQAVVNQQSLERGTVVRPLMREAISAMSKIIRETQGISMGLRMHPVKQTFQKMQRIVRDTSSMLGKDVELHLSGEDTEVDKTVLESLSDPLVHIIRNAVDHGLECPSARLSAGKTEKGHIFLSAFHRAGYVVIEIRDDGQGLNAEGLVAKAKSKNFIPADAVLSPDQVYQLIFTPGLSTKECITEVSGRGVGMDVVRTNVAALQGKIEIETELGKGTCFRILLPLTLAIIDSIVVRCGDERYVIPLSQVSEFFCPTESEVNFACGRSEFLTLRNEPLGTFRLSSLIKQKSTVKKDAWTQTALIVNNGISPKFAVMVDKVIAQQQVVIKALGNELKHKPGLLGSAILGDGKPAFILDLLQLSEPYRSNERKRNESETTTKMEVA